MVQKLFKHCLILIPIFVNSPKVFAATFNSFTLRDGPAEYSLTGLINQRENDQGGKSDFITQNLDHMVQNWFWYREKSRGDRREYALSNQLSAARPSNAPNRFSLRYCEPINNGNDGGLENGTCNEGLLIDLDYRLRAQEISSVFVIATLEIEFEITNLFNSEVSLDFFSYADFDLVMDKNDDKARLSGFNNRTGLQVIEDPIYTGVYLGEANATSFSSLKHWEITSAPSLLSKLADDTQIGDLPDKETPFNGDYGGAFEFEISLDAAGGNIDNFSGKITKIVSNIPTEIPEYSSILSFLILGIINIGSAFITKRKKINTKIKEILN